MTQEEKQLLLKDLCTRLPYGVVIHTYYNKPMDIKCTGCDLFANTVNIDIPNDDEAKVYVQNIRPYLRPMSSMTEEEEKEIRMLHHCFYREGNGWITAGVFGTNDCGCTVFEMADILNYLNAHHFDYRGLIEKGLALEAPDGMYNKEESEKESEIPIPKTVNEAVKTLAKILSKEDRDYLLENGAISMHDSLGRWIRNEWGLLTGSELKDELMNMNKGLNHPDDMSNYIIEEFIKYWNNKL